jgi:hypothetical protein
VDFAVFCKRVADERSEVVRRRKLPCSAKSYLQEGLAAMLAGRLQAQHEP